jgi:Xaa-Pro aminopeptidase
MAEAGLDVLLISAGTDLRYLTGYEGMRTERLVCLVLPVLAEPFLVVPRLEEPGAVASGVPVEVVAWDETDDPYALVARRVTAKRAGVDNHMWAEQVLAFRAAMPSAGQELAGTVLSELRMRKTPQEADSLRAAGAAIDRVHASMGDWLRAGRTESEVARDIADAIVRAGHSRADFVIVAAGPNGSSPHHEVSGRVIQPGEPVVVDIGGTMPDGYRSDCTRTYSVGEPPAAFLAYYEVLLRAQRAQTGAVRPGLTAAGLDAIGREIITEAGYGAYFVHRTGHGIGLDTHEEPYIVSNSGRELEPGMAFSVEPGIYLPGEHGARIEDIVLCAQSGGERLNLTQREVRILE